MTDGVEHPNETTYSLSRTSDINLDSEIDRSSHHAVATGTVRDDLSAGLCRANTPVAAAQTTVNPSASSRHPPRTIARLAPRDISSFSTAIHPDSSVSQSLLDPNRNALYPLGSETTLWAWDTPLENVGESSSYFYEPQGELLPDLMREPDLHTGDSLPHSTGRSGTALLPQSPSLLKTDDGFAIPKLPSDQRSGSAVGTKRKALHDSVTALQYLDIHKRMTMSDASEDSRTPSTRLVLPNQSQSAPNPATAPFDQLTSTTVNDSASSQDATVKLVLPPRKVFPIQVGDKLFRLSGASLSSDAPSYFSQFFEEQLRHNEEASNVRTLYIDRDPATFEDIALHLKGYHIQPRDGTHFVKLFADAQFFSLPRLTAQLQAAPIYICIGGTDFQVPRDIFTGPGDSPNYFTLGFSTFFSTPTNAFPGLNQRTLLRPPSIVPPTIPQRSAKTFADILHLLKGYPLEIRSPEHRTELLRDAKYFHLKGLEQKLINHHISYNLARKSSEILLCLDDIRQSGLSVIHDEPLRPAATTAGDSSGAPPGTSVGPNAPGWVSYQRPYVDTQRHILIIEITSGEACRLSVAPGSRSAPARFGRGIFFRQTRSRIINLLSVIANKMNLPIVQPLGLIMEQQRRASDAGSPSVPPSPSSTGISDERIKVRIGTDADVRVNGRKWPVGQVYRPSDPTSDDTSTEGGMDVDSPGHDDDRRKGKRPAMDQDEGEGEEWIVQKAQWRIRVQAVPNAAAQTPGKSAMEVILCAVKIEAVSNERGRNESREFLA